MNAVNRFFNSIKERADLVPADLIGFFVYYLTVEAGNDVATTANVEECFRDCDLPLPKNTSAYLSKGLKGAQPKYVKANGGYRLHRHYRDQLSGRVRSDRVDAQTSADLRRVEAKLPPGSERDFLAETISCFEAGANRAAVIMCWILVLDHLYTFVYQNHLGAFNEELAKVADRRVKTSKVSLRDDFADVPENKFIELLRASNIISNDVRKILDEKLGFRNSSAHPSGIVVKRSKAIAFIEDLIENVILKYKV